MMWPMEDMSICAIDPNDLVEDCDGNNLRMLAMIHTPDVCDIQGSCCLLFSIGSMDVR